MFKLLKDKLKSFFGTEKKEEKAKKPKKTKIKEEEQEKKEPKEEKKGFFSNILSKFTTSKIEKQQVEQIFEDLEIILLEHNVALEVVDKIKENLINSLVGQESKSKDIKNKVIQSIKTAIEGVLTDSPNLIDEIKNYQGTYIILFFGINGTGKTTSIAKLANLLKKNNISVVLAAADTFRAAAIEQMEKLIRTIKPNKKIFVGESTTGNDMLEQIKTFDEALGIDGIILSKADIDEKGGTALSVSYITKKPIYFLGTGQTYDDLKEFKKKDILESLGLD